MEKLRCEIIQDLIPSYVDGVCSGATRECVEEHMESCEDCRKLAALCREKGISGEQLEQRELDGLKKIKKITKYKGIACCGLTAFILGYMVISIWGNLNLLSTSAATVLFITCTCLVLLSGMGFKGKKAPGWPDALLGVAPVAAVLYILGLILYLLDRFQNGADYVFGRELSRTGAFLGGQMGLVLLVLLGCFLYHLLCVSRQDKNCNWLLCLDVAGCYGVWRLYSFLSNMADPQTLMSILTRETAELVVISLIGIGASVLIGIKSRKNRKRYAEELR